MNSTISDLTKLIHSTTLYLSSCLPNTPIVSTSQSPSTQQSSNSVTHKEYLKEKIPTFNGNVRDYPQF